MDERPTTAAAPSAGVSRVDRIRAGLARWGPTIAGAVLVLGLIGLGSRKLPGSGPEREPLAINFDLQQALTNFFLTVGGITAFVVLVLIFWPGEEQFDLPKRSLTRYVVGPLIIIGLVWLLFRFSITPTEPASQLPSPDSVGEIASPSPSGGGSTWGFYALLGALSIALLAVARSRSRESSPPLPPEPADDFDVDLARHMGLPEESMQGDEPGARVIRAYSGMIRTFALRQLPPRASETPREFLQRAVASASAATQPARELTRLFEIARFSQHPVSAADADSAESATLAVERSVVDSR